MEDPFIPNDAPGIAMRLTYLVQTIGTTAVAGAFLASDLLAQLLEQHPGSETLWYLQLGVLKPFSALQSSGAISDTIAGSHILTLGTVILAAAWLACWFGQRLVVGLMANCSLFLIGSMAYQYLLSMRAGRTASLQGVVFDPPPDSLLLLSLGAVTVIACLACHVSWINDIRRENAEALVKV